jgi:aldose 1-epimerase
MEISRGEQSFEWDLTLGGRLVSWRVHGLELLAHHGDDPVEFGMYPMAPWAGRVRDNAISPDAARRMGVDAPEGVALDINYPPWALHGTCFTSPVETMEGHDHTVTSRQRIPNWPWSAELINSWQIREDGLDVTMTVKTEQASPVILGWHPWFRRTIEGSFAQLSVDSAAMAVRDGAFANGQWLDIADTQGPYDDAFWVPSRRVDITWPEVLSLSVQSSHPWFVIFDELEDSICVEPQTQIPNSWIDPIAGESDVAIPGIDVNLATKWRWRIL